MYTIHLFNDGTMVTAAKHALVKGMEDDEFNKMLPTTSNIDLSSLISNNSNINLSTTTAVPQRLVPATITGPPLLNSSFRVLNSKRKLEMSNILANTNENCPNLPAPCTTMTTVPTQTVAQPTPTFSKSRPPMSQFLTSVDHHNQSMN